MIQNFEKKKKKKREAKREKERKWKSERKYDDRQGRCEGGVRELDKRRTEDEVI